MSFRVIGIFVEVLVLIGVIYSLLFGVRMVIFDIGLEPKYDRFVKWVLILVGSLISVFFIAHLTLFYPRLVP